MKGFMRQRGASFELRVYLGRDPLTGSKRYVTQRVRGGKREVQTALAELVTEAERGLTVRTTATVGTCSRRGSNSLRPTSRRRRSRRRGATSTAR